MSELICVYSERIGKAYHVDKGEVDLQMDDFCIIESLHGGELAQVIGIGSKMYCDVKPSCSRPKVVRKATQEDMEKFNWMKDKEKIAFDFCLQRIKARNLSMKLVTVRYFFNEKKGIFYYTADGRVDFRILVKDMAKEFKMRIEMRQIGVRDEAKMFGGIGVCGRVLCCFSFMNNFEPVTIQKAKKQQIAINPTKISGLCGRLMCCLAFEDESMGRMYTSDEKVED
ncbi:MAG: hypothetical protein KAX11_06505 [Candidatus Aminicenantes bacterium]|nr:hypothetical protein [Candidatus Aminicenantes bacterium]